MAGNEREMENWEAMGKWKLEIEFPLLSECCYRWKQKCHYVSSKSVAQESYLNRSICRQIILEPDRLYSANDMDAIGNHFLYQAGGQISCIYD